MNFKHYWNLLIYTFLLFEYVARVFVTPQSGGCTLRDLRAGCARSIRPEIFYSSYMRS